ncbi:chaperone protein dnaJ 20, chloroplastic-like [Hibiscus syriacus]|uniref:chaperone protein dnaJ 20, chloroplastic-like n=1 Tax=Hibiscus syriacus TaxID=106335 RepID=UPI001922D058|nr:chaperone protein dnaJ 20, chloroplastic-like [Hibiscus syriacus]
MDISNSMNLNTSTLTMAGMRQKPYKVQVISCKGSADDSCMPRGNASFYQVLRLNQAVGLDEIKKAYRSLVLRYHPDVCASSSKDESTKRFLELQMAYETLSDPVSRQMYDYQLSFENCLIGERRSKFPRHIWEKQLHGLKKRSDARMNNMYR